MNMLAGIALHVLPEEEAFWCLVTILQKLMVENYYSGSLLGAIADQMVLNDLIKDYLPKLSHHMEKYGIEPHLICLNWFITVFADVMPTHQILKIWDTFLLDGRKTIFRYALAILHLHEDNLMQKDDPILLHNYIRLVCAHWIDFDLLRHIAFTKFKSIPKTSRLDELHRVHLLPLTVEHEKRESKKRKKKINVPLSHSAFLMPQSASYSPIVQRPSNESSKLREERKWECGANLLLVEHGFLLCAGECMNSSLYMCKPIDNTDEYSYNPLDLEIGSTVYCMIEIGPFWILGTSNGWLYGIDKVTQQMLWKSELKETPLCFYAPNSEASENNRLYLGLANGKLHSFTLQGLPITLQDGLMLPELFPADTVVVGLGNEPISCLESPGDKMLCCGVGGRICVLETESTQQLYDMIVSSEKRRSIREMRRSRFGLWVSLKGSCILLLYKIQSDSHTLMHKLDYNPYILPSLDFTKLPPNNSTLPLAGKDNRPTTMLVRGDELWIGTHKGSILVFNIGKEKRDILTDTQLLEIQRSVSLEKESSIFGLSNEIPLIVIPDSDERQEVTTVKLLTIQNICEHPVRVLLDCDPTDNLGVLTAAGAIGCDGSVRIWKREMKSVTYNSCFVKFTPSVLPPHSLADPNFHTPQVDNIIGFGCENSLSFSQNSYAPNGEVEIAPLSPIHEAQVDEFRDIS
ncbi:hypothetical protein LOD99_3436 [Oopsacas minuta]|uniref:Rab-GAP TBC domain-containing protein n=1 Tax=Oopsacas minuta TaxID=111878 RepID=A0AAV7JX89_9METZ|nr:hypothetical protein LOD99_3436 [Oopsacas minuta]